MKILMYEMKKIVSGRFIKILLAGTFLLIAYINIFGTIGTDYKYDEYTGTLQLITGWNTVKLYKEETDKLVGVISEEDFEKYVKGYNAILDNPDNYKGDITGNINDLKPEIRYGILHSYTPILPYIQAAAPDGVRIRTLKEIIPDAVNCEFGQTEIWAELLKSLNGSGGIILSILVIASTSIIFAGEKETKTDQLIYMSKENSKVNIIKTAASFLFTSILYLIYLIINFGSRILIWGKGDVNIAIQMNRYFIDYEASITFMQMMAMAMAVFWLGLFMLTSIVLFISSACPSKYTAIIISFILVVVSYIPSVLMPPGIIHWTLYLPTSLLRPLTYFVSKERYTLLFPIVIAGCAATVFMTLICILYTRFKKLGKG